MPTLEASYAEAVHRLSVLAGRPPAALSEQLKLSKPIPAPRLPIPTGIPADILLSRPDVRLAERQYAQYTAKVGQAQAARYPTVSLTGDISTTAYRLGDLGKNSSIGWSFGPTLSVPLFNAGQLKAAVEVAQAQRDQYFIAYRSSVLTAHEDVENALVALAQEHIRISNLAASAKSYGEAARLEGTLYKAGETSLLDVLSARSIRPRIHCCKAASFWRPTTSPSTGRSAAAGTARSIPPSPTSSTSRRGHGWQ